MTPYVKHIEIKSLTLSLNLYPQWKTHIIHNSYSLNVCHQYISKFSVKPHCNVEENEKFVIMRK